MGILRDTLIDLKNGLPPRPLADRLHARGIVFVHVPKCAGTSVEYAIRRHYRLSRYLIDPETSFAAAQKSLGLPETDEHRHAFLCEASELRRQVLHYTLGVGYKCITGHAPLGSNTIAGWQESHDFVTLLREPVTRYISHLAYNFGNQHGHGGVSGSLDTFLESPRARMMGTLYPKYFAGLPMSADLGSAEAISQAKDTLKRCAVVGFMDDMAAFKDDLTCLTGHKIIFKHENQTGEARKQKLQLSGAQLEKIRTLCAADIEIYNWAKEHLP
jgi:hypothetical protein